jgi:hypothetical protein
MSKSEWEDKSIDTTFEQNVAVADAKFVKYPVGKYNLYNPHPGYGVDPNIMNEFGHTIYPKFIKIGEESRIVNSAREEMELTGKQPEENPAVKDSPWK